MGFLMKIYEVKDWFLNEKLINYQTNYEDNNVAKLKFVSFYEDFPKKLLIINH